MSVDDDCGGGFGQKELSYRREHQIINSTIYQICKLRSHFLVVVDASSSLDKSSLAVDEEK